MIVFDPTFFALAIPAVVFAGVSKAGFGSGAAFAAAPILALILEPGLALGVMLPLLMLVDAVTLRPYWGKWRLPEAKALIIGGLPGVALGAYFFRSVDDDTLRLAIGALALGFVAYQLTLARRFTRNSGPKLNPAIGLLAGTTAGFTSFVSHAGGPPAAVFLLSRGLNKTEYQATSVLVFWAINIFKFVPYAVLGAFTTQTFLANLYLAPAALVGAALGVYAHRLVPERAFFALTYILLTITGTKLIWDALV